MVPDVTASSVANGSSRRHERSARRWSNPHRRGSLRAKCRARGRRLRGCRQNPGSAVAAARRGRAEACAPVDAEAKRTAEFVSPGPALRRTRTINAERLDLEWRGDNRRPSMCPPLARPSDSSRAHGCQLKERRAVAHAQRHGAEFCLRHAVGAEGRSVEGGVLAGFRQSAGIT